MYFTVPSRTITSFINLAIQDNVDPFGILKQNFDLKDITAGDEFMGELIDDVLNGQNGNTRANVIQWPSLGKMNTVVADLLHSLGLDPAVLCVLGDVLAVHDFRMTIIDDAGEDETIVEFNDRNWSISLSQDIWYQTIADYLADITMPAIPVSVTAIAAGKPLSEILSHPVLDRYKLEINQAFPGSGNNPKTLLRCSSEFQVLNTDQLDTRYPGRWVKAA